MILLKISYLLAIILLDAWATHLFVSHLFALSLNILFKEIPYIAIRMHIKDPCSQYLPDVNIQIVEHHLPIELVVTLSGFDVILDMN